MNRYQKLAAAVLSLALVSPAFADGPAAPAKPAAARSVAQKIAPADPRLTPPIDKLDLKDGDTVVFLGDSITHQCLYTQYLEDFFYTRYPNVHVRFHNSGVGGDRASDALARFDLDVAAYKPKYVTILLGMNDGGYRQWNAETFGNYERDMLKLLDRIKEIGATAVVMGPTMFDRDALLIKPNPKNSFESEKSKYYNAVLAFYGTFMRDQALERGLNYVDMISPLEKLSVEQREKDPNFTMIPDSVHPDPNGQVIMAAAVLEALHVKNNVSSTTATLDPAKGWSVTIPGGKVTDVAGDATHLTFTAQEPCVPWILPAEAAIGYKLAIAGHHHSSEPFRVVGLAPGKYDVKIDGQSIGTFPAATLNFKIELQNFEQAPQYQQALAVAMLNKEKNEKAMHPIRDLYLQLKFKRLDKKGTPETVNAFIEEMKPKVEALEKAKADYEQRIYGLAQPKMMKYEITKVSN